MTHRIIPLLRNRREEGSSRVCFVNFRVSFLLLFGFPDGVQNLGGECLALAAKARVRVNTAG